MPAVSRLTVAPVKGLAVSHPDEIRVERGGVPGNRQFFLVDETGRLFASIRDGRLVTVAAEFEAEPERLALRFADGAVVEDEVRLGEPVAATLFDRPVPAHAVEGPFAAALSELVGKPLRLLRADDLGAAWDARVVSLLSDASVEELHRRAGRDGPADGRRFRMLVSVAGCEPHAEDGWIGSRVRLGEALVEVVATCVRCATTTRNPDTGVRDFDTLRAIPAYRGLAGGKDVEFGVYADVVEPGTVRVGDPVEPLAG